MSSLSRSFINIHVLFVTVLFVHEWDDVMCVFVCDCFQFIKNWINKNGFDLFLELFLEGHVHVGVESPLVVLMITSLPYDVYLIL